MFTNRIVCSLIGGLFVLVNFISGVREENKTGVFCGTHCSLCPHRNRTLLQIYSLLVKALHWSFIVLFARWRHVLAPAFTHCHCCCCRW